jgi:hypothetical protein
MAIHPTVGLWIIGVVLIAIGWYTPNGFGWEFVGALALIVGTAIGLLGK